MFMYTHTYRICPIFQVSNVKGTNLDKLTTFLNLLSGRMHTNEDKPAEFQIDETYSVPVSETRAHTSTCTIATFPLPVLCFLIHYLLNFRVWGQLCLAHACKELSG